VRPLSRNRAHLSSISWTPLTGPFYHKGTSRTIHRIRSSSSKAEASLSESINPFDTAAEPVSALPSDEVADGEEDLETGPSDHPGQPSTSEPPSVDDNEEEDDDDAAVQSPKSLAERASFPILPSISFDTTPILNDLILCPLYYLQPLPIPTPSVCSPPHPSYLLILSSHLSAPPPPGTIAAVQLMDSEEQEPLQAQPGAGRDRGHVSSHIQEVMKRLFNPAKPHLAAWVWLYDIDRYWTERMPTMHPTQPEAVPLYSKLLPTNNFSPD
jgi:hypothetical protein